VPRGNCGFNIDVSRTNALEHFHTVGGRIDVQASPALAISPEGLGRLYRMVCADVDVESRTFTGQEQFEEYVLTIL